MSRLLELVESLQTGLSNPDRLLQRDAFRTLNDGLTSLPLSEFSPKEVTHLVDFYVANMATADPALISSVLDGLNWLSSVSQLSGINAVKVCVDGFFSSLPIRSLGRNERKKAVQLLSSLLSNGKTREGLLQMKQEFIRGYIASVEEEKDPEILMLVFPAHCVVMRYFELGHLEEDFFDIVAAYFPVDYSPPPGKSLDLKRSDLVAKLNDCLFASRLFAGSLLLPLLIEKAGSQWSDGRSDALDLLADSLNGFQGCVETYSDFSLKPPSTAVASPLPFPQVSAYLFALCNLVRELAIQLDPSERGRDSTRLLAIVHGITCAYVSQPSVHTIEDFSETFLNTLCPDREKSVVFDSWFSVPPKSTLTALPNPAPQGLLADCLIAAVSSAVLSASTAASSNDYALARILLSRLFHRLAAPLLTPVMPSMPDDRVFYDAKFDQLVTWTPHLGFLNRLMAVLEKRLAALEDAPNIADFFLSRGELRAVQSNLSRFLELACVRYGLCTAGETEILNSTSLQLRLTEASLFNFLCRLLLLEPARPTDDYVECLPSLCKHLMMHIAKSTDESIFQLLKLEQKNLLSQLICSGNSVGKNLRDLLFEILEDKESGNLAPVALEVLQRSACENESVLNQLLKFLFSRLNNGPFKINEVIELASTLVFITRTLNGKKKHCLVTVLEFLTEHSTHFYLLADSLHADLTAGTETEKGQKAANCIASLSSAFRFLVAGLPNKSQTAILESFNLIGPSAQAPSNDLARLLLTAVISALRSDIFIEHSQELLPFMFCTIERALKQAPTMSVTLLDLTSSELSTDFACILNKSPCAPVIEFADSTLDLLMTAPTADVNQNRCQLSAPFILLGLRALLNLPTSAAQPQSLALQHRLLSLLIPPADTVGQSEGPAYHLRVTCLTDYASLLLPGDIETTDGGRVDFLSETFHCTTSVLYTQKCYCLVGQELLRAWQSARKQYTTQKPPPSSSPVTVIEDACLRAYLQLSSLLPESILGDIFSDVIEAAVLAVTTGVYSLPTQTLGLALISTLATVLPSSVRSGISDGHADDLFEKLPVILQHTSGSSANDDPAKVEREARMRYHLAVCLSTLVDFPAPITARHKGRVRRILEQLLDDDCRSVRLQASRANIRWYLRV
ncbi:hypothetical protein AAHC03_01449 [Spirometra sp. Aus1]